MPTATINSKGQITIPASVRASMRLKEGSQVEFIDHGDGRFSIVAVTSPIAALKGVLTTPRKRVLIAEMHRAIARQIERPRSSG